MRCDLCGKPIAIYELYPRSYRLYMYLCHNCRKASLAHHFDLELDIYHIEDERLKVRKKDNLTFVEGLEVEPRVFGFKIEKEGKAVVVGDKESALGELAIQGSKVSFAPYSERARKRILRLLSSEEMNDDELAEKLYELLREAE